jgi:hypothetical protein
MMKPITGAWVEFRHHSSVEGTPYNPELRRFTREQWQAMIRDMHRIGMDTGVLTFTSLVTEEEKESYAPVDVFPRPADMGCPEALDAVMDEMEKLGMHIFLGLGFYGLWTDPEGNMQSPEVDERAFRAAETLYARYRGYRCLEGWYLPDETEAGPYFREFFIDYVNRYAKKLRAMDPGKKILIAPYGTNKISTDDVFIDQLRRLDCDYIAYQDEVGVQKSTADETGEYYRRLREAHDRAGRSRLWADMEVFEFAGPVYRSALVPAAISRIERQLEAVSPWVEKVLCYAYPGLMARPGSEATYAGNEPARLYTEYEALAKRIKG